VSIDALIERMETLLGPLEEAGDARRFFHATYLRTTRAVRDALRRRASLSPGSRSRAPALLPALPSGRATDPEGSASR
jgi:hypothetical protein